MNLILHNDIVIAMDQKSSYINYQIGSLLVEGNALKDKHPTMSI